MRTVYKYELIPDVKIPKGSQLLHIDWQHERFQSWWKVDDKETETETRHFFISGTGHELIGEGLSHITTLIVREFVWHIFEVTHV